jgi:hypothetical protein
LETRFCIERRFAHLLDTEDTPDGTPTAAAAEAAGGTTISVGWYNGSLEDLGVDMWGAEADELVEDVLGAPRPRAPLSLVLV